MVFSSFPPYHDPSNWQQQQPTATTVGIVGNSQFLSPTLPPPPPPQQQLPPPPPPLPHGGHGGSSSVRPGSMAERARLANIPMPETALKCPRCESTNTKFCYFNNYSLSQPRHFCKTCRRYWTRGGALRNVPVGGGCRRNKRTKSSSSTSNNSNSTAGGSKSQDSTTGSLTSSGAAGATPMGPTSSLGSIISSYNTGLIAGGGGHDHILGLGSSLPSLKLMAPNLPHHDFMTNSENLGLQYGAVSAPHDITAFQIGGGGGGGASGLLSSFEPWRFPATQLPLLGGLDMSSPSSSSGLYPFDHQSGLEQHQPGFGGTVSGQFRPRNIFHQNPSSSLSSHSAMVTAAASQLASVKVEDNPDQQLNLARQLLGSDQLWNATAAAAATTGSWSDVSNFSSSSTSNPI